MSKSSQAFYEATQHDPDAHMPDNEPDFCAENLPPEYKAELVRTNALNQMFKKIFGNLPF